MTDARSAARSRWGQLVVIALAVLALDQAGKFLAVRNLTTAMAEQSATTLGQQLHVWLGAQHLEPVSADAVHPLVGAFWSWHYAENPGAAFSFAAGWPKGVQVPFFVVVTLLAVGLIAYYYRRLRADQGMLRIALGLVMGGAVGNLVDRIIRGYVIDFIDWSVNDTAWHGGFHWPTFNVADTGITVGVLLIALDSVIGWARNRRQAKAIPARREAGRV